MAELDLHGYTADEALRIFVNAYNRQVRLGSDESIRIIHGYGSSGHGAAGGKIRRRLRQFLESAAGSLEFKPGEDVEGNPGVTIVFPRSILPAREDRLGAGILSFCSSPRTESKIAGEFRTYNAREIKETLRTLVRQGRLKTVVKSGRVTYVNPALL